MQTKSRIETWMQEDIYSIKRKKKKKILIKKKLNQKHQRIQVFCSWVLLKRNPGTVWYRNRQTCVVWRIKVKRDQAKRFFFFFFPATCITKINNCQKVFNANIYIHTYIYIYITNRFPRFHDILSFLFLVLGIIAHVLVLINPAVGNHIGALFSRRSIEFRGPL